MQSYQNQSFEQLLMTGRISEALQLKIEGLESEAFNTRVELEASKAVTLGGVAIGLVFSANPLVALLAGVGGALYVCSLWKDFSQTGKLCPLPGVRKGIMQMIQGAGVADKGLQTEEDPLMMTLGYLEPHQRDEYEVLVARESALTGYLKQFPPEQRLPAYRFAMRHARLQEYLNLPSVEQGKEAIVMPSVEQLPALPPTQLQGEQQVTDETPGLECPQDEPNDRADQVVDGTIASLPKLSDVVMPATALQDDRYSWAKELLHFPAVLIWGAQGSGKTSFAAWLLRERIKAGHEAWVCDPHKEFGQWNGLKVVGSGMDYEACDRAMVGFANTVKQAYKIRSEQANYQPKRETVLVEEFTNWASRCENSAEFFAASLSDLRKIKKGVIFVSHDRSLIALGNAKSFSKARNNGLLELQLEAKIDSITGDPMPALKGKLKLPGKAAIDVDIATWMKGDMDFSVTVQPGSGTVQTVEPDGSESNQNGSDLVQPGSDGSTLNHGSNPVQWLNRCLEAEVQDSEPNGSGFSSDGSAVEPSGSGTFTAENLTAVQARERITDLRAAGLNQTQIILALWRAKKGESKAYKDALAEYKFLIGEVSN